MYSKIIDPTPLLFWRFPIQEGHQGEYHAHVSVGAHVIKNSVRYAHYDLELKRKMLVTYSFRIIFYGWVGDILWVSSLKEEIDILSQVL